MLIALIDSVSIGIIVQNIFFLVRGVAKFVIAETAYFSTL